MGEFMKKYFCDEQGTAIVAALLILLLLTFVALTATDTTINEKAMIRSEALFDQNFSLSESAALEGLQKLANMDNDAVKDLLPKRLASGSTNEELLIGSDSEEMKDIVEVLDVSGDGGHADGVIDKQDFYTDTNGNGQYDTGEEIANPSFERSNIGADTYRTAMMLPIANGDSLSVTTATSRLYRYNTFGLSEDNGGKSLILVGYKRRIDH